MGRRENSSLADLHVKEMEILHQGTTPSSPQVSVKGLKQCVHPECFFSLSHDRLQGTETLPGRFILLLHGVIYFICGRDTRGCGVR